MTERYHEIVTDKHWRQSRWGPGVRTPPTFSLPESAYWWTRAQFSQNLSVLQSLH